jgi:CMP-N-acetylneuraminic acid synthetase
MKIIIPASAKNQYSEKGDFVSFGGTTLIQWKLSQALKVTTIENIFVTTADTSSARLLAEIGVNTLLRKDRVDIKTLYLETAQRFAPNDHIMWLNATSPFVGPLLMKKMINLYKEIDNELPLVSAVEEYEYFYKKDEPYKASSLVDTTRSRKDIDPFIRITNGASICCVKSIIDNGTVLSPTVHYYIVPWLASLEVKDRSQLDLYPQLICSYYETEK